MKFSENWLREWVNPAVTTEQLCEQITMLGLEVDGVDVIAGEFNGVVVGEVVECAQHPDGRTDEQKRAERTDFYAAVSGRV